MTWASRVIIGASGSPGSLRALRFARDIARRDDATLIPVIAWIPPGGELAERRAPSPGLRRVWHEAATERLRAALAAAWGDAAPDGLVVRPCVARGQSGPVLVDLACRPGDLLIIGAGRRGPLGRIRGGRVGRYCLAHASCLVVAVPPPALAGDVGPGLWHKRFWHRPLTADQVLREWHGSPA